MVLDRPAVLSKPAHDDKASYNSHQKNLENAKYEIPGEDEARGASGPQYLLGIGKSSIKTTAEPEMALRMGKFTAQDAIDYIQSARCITGAISNACRKLNCDFDGN